VITADIYFFKLPFKLIFKSEEVWEEYQSKNIPSSSTTGKADTLFSANIWNAVISGVSGDICRKKCTGNQ